jgi:hypothetical protein
MAQQWLSASDPFFSQFSGTVDESGYVAGPYDSQVAGLQSPQNWEAVAPQLGWTGPLRAQYIGPDGNVMEDYSPEFLNWIQSKRAEGYDFVTDASQINKDRQTIGFRLPTGEVTNQRTVKVSGFGDFFKEFVLPSVGIAFGMGGFNSLMGGAGAGANALSGAGLGAMEGVGLSGNIINAATGQTIASLPTAAMTAADIGRGLGDVLGQVNQPPVLETANFAPLENAVANVTTPAAQLTDASNAMQLRPLTQLQPITQTPNALAGIEGLAGVPVDPAFAAGMGVDAGMAALAPATGTAVGAAGGGAGAGAVGATGGSTAPSSGGFLRNMSETAATEGAGVAGTGILTKGTNIPSAVLGGGNLVDRALNLIKTPAGQAVLGGVGSAVGGVLEANAAEQAAETQSQAAQNALALQREMFEYQKGLLEPYRTAGTKALDRLSGAMGLGGPGSQQQMLEMDPGYGFRLGEGLKALERLQASRGNFLSGGALKAGQRFAQDTASQEYGNAYNRLANIAGLGQTAGTQMGGAAAGFGTSAGNIMGQEANALAAGRMGRASAYTGAIGGALGSYQNYLNRQQEERLVRDIFGRTTVGG